MIKRFGLVCGAILLAACQTVEPPPPSRNLVDLKACGADQYTDLIGQDATALERVLILGRVRVIRPTDIITQDFRPDRINFMIGGDERIDSIRCG